MAIFTLTDIQIVEKPLKTLDFQEVYCGEMYRILANYDLFGNDIELQWLDESSYRLDNFKPK